MAEIEREEARRQLVKEIVVEPPSRRVNFTLNAHPFKNELIMLGGELFNGQQVFKKLIRCLNCIHIRKYKPFVIEIK